MLINKLDSVNSKFVILADIIKGFRYFLNKLMFVAFFNFLIHI